jgi:hypothetical protein
LGFGSVNKINYGSTFSPINTLQGQTFFMPPAIVPAPLHGLQSLKQKIFFAMVTFGVLDQAPPPFGFTIGAHMV